MIQLLNEILNSWVLHISILLVIVLTLIHYIGTRKRYEDFYPAVPVPLCAGKVVIITESPKRESLLTVEVARELCRRECYVILAIGNAFRAKLVADYVKTRIPKAKILIKLLNLNDLTSVREFVKQIEIEFSHVDVLINNATLKPEDSGGTVDATALVTTNYLGVFLMTHLLLSLMNKEKHARIINITYGREDFDGLCLADADLAQMTTLDNDQVFRLSKLALTGFSAYLAMMLHGTSITVNTVQVENLKEKTCPFYSTDKISSLMPLVILTWPLKFLTNLYAKDTGWRTVVYAAIEPSLKSMSGYHLNGRFNCSMFQQGATQLSSTCESDYVALNKLYDKSCQIVGIDGAAIVQMVKV